MGFSSDLSRSFSPLANLIMSAPHVLEVPDSSKVHNDEAANASADEAPEADQELFHMIGPKKKSFNSDVSIDSTCETNSRRR